MHKEQDADISKGAVEQDDRSQPTNTSLSGQLPHRTSNRLVKSNDSDFPEPGNNPEHSGESMDKNLPQDEERNNPQSRDRENPEAQLNDQDPGQRQKQNQNQKKDDDLAA